MSRYTKSPDWEETDDYADDESFWNEVDEVPVRTRGQRVRRALLMVLVGLLVAALCYGGYYAFRILRAMDNVDRDESMLPSDNRPPAATAGAGAQNPPMSFVLIGTDSRNGESGLSDSLMIGYLSGDRQALYLISFPRDMWVTIPGHGEAKINAAHSYGGAALTVQTLEELLGVRMDHAVGIDFQGFIELTTALGGVTVYNQYESSVAGYHWPVGEITIQGDEALAYVRQRHDLPDGDLSRAERQRAVVTGMIDKVVSPEVLANPARMGAFLDQAAGTVTVDAGLTNDTIYTLARQLGFSGSDGVKSLQAPAAGLATSADGQSIVLVNWDQLAELATAMQSDTMADYYAKYGG